MVFDWDDAKRRQNIAKHGVDFAAIGDFDWSTAVIRPDRRRDYGEARLTATGMIGARLHVAIYNVRHGRLRIISLRKANKREVKDYARNT